MHEFNSREETETKALPGLRNIRLWEHEIPLGLKFRHATTMGQSSADVTMPRFLTNYCPCSLRHDVTARSTACVCTGYAGVLSPIADSWDALTSRVSGGSVTIDQIRVVGRKEVDFWNVICSEITTSLDPALKNFIDRSLANFWLAVCKHSKQNGLRVC